MFAKESMTSAHLDENSPFEHKKLFYLAFCLFFIVASYSLLKPLKNSVFFGIIGRDWQPWAKFLSIAFLPVLMFFYSISVDRMRRYQLVITYCLFYAVSSVIFGLLLMHPVFGLPNTMQSGNRILGWLFYLSIDFYPILIVTTFWAFSNSISSPTSAKNTYGYIVAASKISGIISPFLGLYLLNMSGLSETLSITTSLMLVACFLCGAAFAVTRLVRNIPGRYLHGYEAVYEVEKQKKKEAQPKTGIFQGFKLMLVEPYVFGIFGLVYSYEIISSIIDYQKDYIASIKFNNNISLMYSFNLWYTIAWQALGLLFALVGTSQLLKKFDVEKCLISVPIIIGSLMVCLFFFPDLWTIFIVMIIMRALNYGFNVPIREMLYIPTVKDIKFKSKAWTDSFGRTISKASGAGINVATQGGNLYAFMAKGTMFSIPIVIAWTIASYFVAKRYKKTIVEGTVIGENTQQ